jgi:predicted dehydrogenase
MKQFRVAMVGCGNISRMHFDAYLPHPERIQVVAGCDSDGERIAETRQRYGLAQGFSSVEEMIAQAEWEIAVVCTPTHVRREVVEMLARAGKHIFVEKPFADGYDDALRMVEACQRVGVQLAVNQNFRYHYPFEMARKLVRQGQIGHVVQVIHQDLMFRQDTGWRTHLKRHALAVMGVHWFDGFRQILHDEASSLVCQTRSSAAIQCAGETEASVQINFTQGALVSYIESFSTPGAVTSTRILGEQGELVLDYDRLNLFDAAHRGKPQESWDNPYRAEHKPKATFLGINLLLEAIERGTEPANSGSDNLKTIALLDGAYRSAETQRAVTFREGMPL